MSDELARRLKEGQVKVFKMSDISNCPHSIMMPEHYRDDGTCRCNDKDDPNMGVWGYYWDDRLKVWVADEPNQEG